MNFTYRIRRDTKAEQLDTVEYIKYRHRAGMTENQYIPLDIHVPKKIIAQIAFDAGIPTDDFSGPRDPDEMLKYLNSRSLIPFLYKRRNATGTGEYFIRIENAGVHIRSEMPTFDEQGERQDAETTNYTVDFSVEIEMTAPYCYTYYSQHEQNFINSEEFAKDETAIVLMKAARVDLPEVNEVGWNQLIKTEYVVDMEDLKDYVKIDFRELLEGSELLQLIEYTKSVALNPSLFIDFIIHNEYDFINYDIDWDNYTLTMKQKVTHPGFVIGIYTDMKYINETKIHHNFADGFNNPDSFRTSSRIGKID